MEFFFFQAEDGIRDAQESRGLGDVYKRQLVGRCAGDTEEPGGFLHGDRAPRGGVVHAVRRDLSLIHI